MTPFVRKIFIASLLLTLGIGFAGGFFFSDIRSKQANNIVIHELGNRDVGQPDSIDFSLFWQVWDALHAKYVDSKSIDARKALYGAIAGMVKSVGDPYTVFFEPVTAKKFEEEINGAFGGVGMEIGKRNDAITVIAPLKDTPAFRAGIQAGDIIVSIDGTSTADMSVEEAVNLIRGKKGTTVTLGIDHNGDASEKKLVRDTIKVPTVEWKMLDGHIAYMQIFEFNQNVDAQFKTAAQEILASGADRLIIDLRNNPGGLLDSAVNLAGWFLDNGSLVTTEDFGNGLKNEFRTSGNAALKKLPTAILINGGSASASEILSGALHDNRKLPLVGEKSFGKGSVQQLESFADGSSLKVTVAKWLTPSGISISEKGIEPTTKVTLDQTKIQSGDLQYGEPGKDPQLDKAVEVVNNL